MVQRFSRLVKYLNAMSSSFYDMSPIDGEEGRTFCPGALSNVTINEEWLRAQIRFAFLNADTFEHSLNVYEGGGGIY